MVGLVLTAHARPNVVVGAGIVGLAVAKALQELDPDRPTLVLEKESRVAAHQTGHNSGVIHSGLYYAPGSLKARLAVRGAQQLQEYCIEWGIRFDVPGKLVVATREEELPKLEQLVERGHQNGVPVRHAQLGEVAEREPALRVKGAIVVDSTGRVDYRDVAAVLAKQIVTRGGAIRSTEAVTSVEPRNGEVRVHTDREVVVAHRVAVCAGLQSDRLARASGVDPGVRILPFRGEYSELVPARADLVRGLVYPVPDPDLPFLGVHLTRGIDGVVHVGPNAVPALAREGYRWSRVSVRDLAEAVTYPGSWRLARRYGKVGAQEIGRSLTGRSLAKAAREMLPDLRASDLRRAGAGVRAQAVARDGRLVDDFLFQRAGSVLHVLNAPSPAATACLPIGEYIAKELLAP
ncbi:MAG: hydroxyglutarate oxidase [Frankiales bacterium]|nr:hydroxyglutarate oxidase [Frankiales bacterium]